MLTFINPPRLYDPTPNGYAHVVVAPNTGRVTYIAGQGGERSDGSLPASLGSQMDQAFQNLRTALEGMMFEVDAIAHLGSGSPPAPVEPQRKDLEP